MSDYECPYCGDEKDYCDDPLTEGRSYEEECSECGMKYLLSCSYSVSYDAEKADCLNGRAEHRFEDASQYPFVRNGKVTQRCKGCFRELRRSATQEEIDDQIRVLGEKFRGYTDPTQQEKQQ